MWMNLAVSTPFHGYSRARAHCESIVKLAARSGYALMCLFYFGIIYSFMTIYNGEKHTEINTAIVKALNCVGFWVFNPLNTV